MAVDKQLPQVSYLAPQFSIDISLILQFFSKVNRWGVPYYAVLVSFAFGPLAYLSRLRRVSRC
jgi:hypothetical protein